MIGRIGTGKNRFNNEKGSNQAQYTHIYLLYRRNILSPVHIEINIILRSRGYDEYVILNTKMYETSGQSSALQRMYIMLFFRFIIDRIYM